MIIENGEFKGKWACVSAMKGWELVFVPLVALKTRWQPWYEGLYTYWQHWLRWAVGSYLIRNFTHLFTHSNLKFCWTYGLSVFVWSDYYIFMQCLPDFIFSFAILFWSRSEGQSDLEYSEKKKCLCTLDPFSQYRSWFSRWMIINRDGDSGDIMSGLTHQLSGD